MVHLRIFLITKNSPPMVHCKHEYEPSIHRGRSHTGGSRKVTSTTHGVLLYSVFLISWTICVICLCVLVPKNILALQVTKKGKKKAMQIQENSIMLLKKKKNGLHLEMLGFEPRTFCMQSRRSTAELHPLPASLACYYTSCHNGQSTCGLLSMLQQ